MKETLKSKKGITLIALVITIIILIILAGVSIALLSGENGIINKAKETRKTQKIAEIKEKISLELMSAETDAMLRGETLELAQRDDIASKYGTVDGDILTTTDDNYEIDLKEIYNATLSTSGSYTALKQAYETASADLAVASASQSDLATELQKTTATTDDILSGKKAYIGGSVKDGTMVNNGAVDEKIGEGESYTIPAGYHNGSGKVTATAQSIDANAADASKILKDYKAYVNGELVTGTMENIGTATINTTGASGNVTTDITPGYYDKVTVNQTGAYNAGKAEGSSLGANETLMNFVNWYSSGNTVRNYTTQKKYSLIICSIVDTVHSGNASYGNIKCNKGTRKYDNYNTFTNNNYHSAASRLIIYSDCPSGTVITATPSSADNCCILVTGIV